MATNLFDALGLPGLPPGYALGQGQAAPKAAPDLRLKRDPAEAKKTDSRLPADPAERAKFLADLIPRVQDAVKKDTLVRALRDTLAKIQPIMDDKEAKKKIDEAINSLIEKGVKDLLMKLLEVVVGKGPTEMPDRDAPRQPTGPPMKERDLGERIFKTPELPLPFDQPAKVKQNQFEFGRIPKTARPGETLTIDLRVRDSFAQGKEKGNGWVAVVSAKENERVINDAPIEKKSRVQVRLRMPDEPGGYQIRIKVGPGWEWVPEPVPVEVK